MRHRYLKLGLDAIILADSGVDSLSATNPLKLKMRERISSVQVIKNLVMF